MTFAKTYQQMQKTIEKSRLSQLENEANVEAYPKIECFNTFTPYHPGLLDEDQTAQDKLEDPLYIELLGQTGLVKYGSEQLPEGEFHKQAVVGGFHSVTPKRKNIFLCTKEERLILASKYPINVISVGWWKANRVVALASRWVTLIIHKTHLSTARIQEIRVSLEAKCVYCNPSVPSNPTYTRRLHLNETSQHASPSMNSPEIFSIPLLEYVVVLPRTPAAKLGEDSPKTVTFREVRTVQLDDWDTSSGW